MVPIPGTTKLHRLEENIGAVDIKLTVDDLNGLDSALNTINIVGARYPEEFEKRSGL